MNKSFNAQTWIDVVLFASAATELLELGLPTKGNIAHTLRTFIEVKAPPRFTSSDEALEFLRSQGFDLGQFRSRRAARGLALQQESEDSTGVPATRADEIASLLGDLQ